MAALVAVPLAPLALTPSGRPVLLAGEAERLLQDKTDAVFVNATGGPTPLPPAPALVDGILRVTTHRLLWVDAAAAPSTGASASLHLAAVTRCELRATRLWSSQKVRVWVSVGGGGGGGAPRLLPAAAAACGAPVEIKLVAPDQAALLAALRASLAARAWERDGSAEAALAPPRPSRPPSTVDAAAVAAVAALGFSTAAATAALGATGGGDPQAAALWLLDHPEAVAGAETGPPPPPAAEPAAAVPSAAAAGVGGLLRREAAAATADAAALDAAFVDLRALMAAAADMVALARRAAAAAGDEPTGLEAELAALGIASPVTRAAAGPLYVKELSRQLADFIAPRLAAAGGLLPLADVYCLFNRARGVELAAPADVAAAAREWAAWRAPVRLREVEGGVLAVQAADLDDGVVRGRLAALAAASGEGDPAAVAGLGRPLTPSVVAAELRVPLAVAAALLLDAERAGALCRDEGAEGVRWWANFFAQNTSAAQALVKSR